MRLAVGVMGELMAMARIRLSLRELTPMFPMVAFAGAGATTTACGCRDC
jgi:hypothetical protein